MANKIEVLDVGGFNEMGMCRTGPMVYNKNDVYVGGSLMRYGEFSVSEQLVFRQIVREDMLVAEIGANIGAHTIELSRLVGANGELHAFEPQRIVFQTLCANLAINQCTNVFAYQSAVGDSTGTIHVPPMDHKVRANFGGVSLANVAIGEKVPLITLDSVDLPACHFLKADVEGMEVEVLRGAAQTIDMYRPLMYVENDRAERSEALLTLIGELGYRAYWHLARLYNPDNYRQVAEDIFPGIVSINVLCIPNEVTMDVGGLRPVTSAQDTWNNAPA